MENEVWMYCGLGFYVGVIFAKKGRLWKISLID